MEKKTHQSLLDIEDGEDEDVVNLVPRIEEPIQVSSCDEDEDSSSSSGKITILFLLSNAKPSI